MPIAAIGAISLLLFSSCAPLAQLTGDASKEVPFTKADVAAAQRLAGLTFSDAEIDTMYDYLIRNRAGFDTMRTFALDYSDLPAILFDPHPKEFIIPDHKAIQEWSVPAGVSLPENRTDLAFYSIMELASLVKSRKITSEELTLFFLSRLQEYDPILKAVITVTEARALAQARRADEEIAAGRYRGPLHGIPYGVKDIISVEGYKTTWGSAPYKEQVLNETAAVVKRLDDAGAVLIAKLTSGALARGDVWFGGKTVSPWDTTQGSSGSSAGSASATAAGLVPFAIGSETWGSIVSPSSRCGVTGLRPTYGRVSRAGVMALAWSMDKVGPICRSAADCALVFDIIRGGDENDPMTQDAPFRVEWEKPMNRFRVGYLEEAFDKDTTEAGDNGRVALEQFRNMGADLIPVKLPEAFPFRTFDIILRAEAGAFFDELVLSGEVDRMVQQSRRSRANSLRQSRFIPAVEYLQANRHRRNLIEKMHTLMKDFDVVLAPQRGGNQTLITNLTGHPALSIPAGFDEKGRPTSIILVGNLYDEASILEVGNLFQQHTEFDDSRPPLFSKREQTAN